MANKIIYDLLVTKFKTIDSIYFDNLDSLNSKHFLLLSGAFDQIERWVNLTECQGYFLVTCPWRSRRLPKRRRGVVWTRINAKNFGCAVDYEILMGARGVKIWTESTQIRRFIEHHIDHGVRPAVHTPCTGDVEVYRGNDRLIPGALDRCVVYPTHFTATGWGIH